mmetsp:Transcript_5287/g.14186  ORF Transcript_5287/g.14186 Transcript_5287/m.14186 type:complete len:138 (+) Transcript_5287:96-509(+)
MGLVSRHSDMMEDGRSGVCSVEPADKKREAACVEKVDAAKGSNDSDNSERVERASVADKFDVVPMRGAHRERGKQLGSSASKPEPRCACCPPRRGKDRHRDTHAKVNRSRQFDRAIKDRSDGLATSSKEHEMPEVNT